MCKEFYFSNGICRKPYGKSSGKRIENGDWKWQKVSWVKCHCGMWHSNRFIPRSFWYQKWEIKNKDRKKVGIMLIRDNSEVWITQSYHNCFGLPKGEKEITETVEECAKREFLEETGCSIENVQLSKCVSIITNIENIQYIFYVIHVPKSFELYTFPVDDVEITSCGWMNLREIDTLKLSKAIKRIFELFKTNSWLINFT